MQATFISSVFAQYMGDWKKSVENNKAWKREADAYRNEKNGFLLTMRFSEHLNVTIYDCCAISASSYKISDLEPFNLEQAWNVMWGKKDVYPSHVTIHTSEDYSALLLNSKRNWIRGEGDVERIYHHQSGSMFKRDQEGMFNYLSIERPTSTQTCLKQLQAIGYPVFMNNLTNAS
ncbi:hypothetical protein [Sutcliffiella cohnii]|uniref:hypothetical protein n=1 Tax=Sutcliffiella cohnii TaxID=33932 RepID=UPI000831AB9D|nr:hypothetical protein [Sutcliffiella cohnii]